jgi:hypothetical protein
MSVDILGLRFQKFLNPANNLDHSLNFPGSRWKITLERVKGFENRTQMVDLQILFPQNEGPLYRVLYHDAPLDQERARTAAPTG